MGKQRSYTPEFKQEAIELAKLGEKPISQIAKELDISKNTLYSWVNGTRSFEGSFEGSNLYF